MKMKKKIYLKYVHNHIVDYVMKNGVYPNAIIIPYFLHKELTNEGTHNVCEQLFGAKIIISYDTNEIMPMVIMD